MKSKFILIAVFILMSTLTRAQLDTFNVYTGPSTWKSFDYSSNVAGPNWNLNTYNDSAWRTPFNGSGAQGGVTTCTGPDQSLWGSIDTAIWSSPTTLAPDTACFRRSLNLPKCGTVRAAKFSIGADDTYFFYINGNFTWH